MPAIPFLADSLRQLTTPGNTEEVAVCQLPFGQASDNAHLPNERLGIRQVAKVRESSSANFYLVKKAQVYVVCFERERCTLLMILRFSQGVDVLACTLEALATRLAGGASVPIRAP